MSEYTIEKEEELIRQESVQPMRGTKTPLRKASTLKAAVSPVRKRRKAMRRVAFNIEGGGFDVGGGDAEEQAAPAK